MMMYCSIFFIEKWWYTELARIIGMQTDIQLNQISLYKYFREFTNRLARLRFPQFMLQLAIRIPTLSLRQPIIFPC